LDFLVLVEDSFGLTSESSSLLISLYSAWEFKSNAAKSHFDHHFSSILAQWGVKPTHTGTCLLLPADWAALDPIRLAALFSPENYPHAWADGVVRSYTPSNLHDK
jgi:hypothetical protein